MTIVSETAIEPGQEPAWDQAYRDRMADAPNQEGWISMQLLVPLDAPNKRIVVGTWRSRPDWEAWHATKVFQKTRDQMNAVQQKAEPERWYEVVAIAGQEAEGA